LMNRPCLLYITDRTAFPGDEPARRSRLLEKISEAARCGVDYIQLREKDLSTRELESLAREAVRAIRQGSKQKTENQDPATSHRPPTTALLINSRTDVALAAGADGVHLRSDDVSPSDARQIWERGAGALARESSPPVIAVSCHSAEEVAQAAVNQATFAVFAPVFEKSSRVNPAGLATLRQACDAPIPVVALGGVSLENVALCLEAGAAGIAAIRLFQENNIADVVSKLR
jgi:thiamine-phosphate pyrophosphorylase